MTYTMQCNKANIEQFWSRMFFLILTIGLVCITALHCTFSSFCCSFTVIGSTPGGSWDIILSFRSRRLDMTSPQRSWNFSDTSKASWRAASLDTAPSWISLANPFSSEIFCLISAAERNRGVERLKTKLSFLYQFRKCQKLDLLGYFKLI